MIGRISLAKRANSVLIAAWAGAVAVLLILALDAIVTSPGSDSAIFLYVAQGILHGEVPYLDRWDNKGPLLYFLNLIGLVIHETWGIFVVQGVFLLCSASIAFLLLKKGFGLLPALLGLAAFLIYYAKFAPPGNFTEQYGLLFQFLALYLFVRSQEQAGTKTCQSQFAWLHLAIGVLGAASFLLRPNLVALWLVIGLYWIIVRGDAVRKLAWAVVGGGSVLLLVAGLFAVLGAWGALWDTFIGFSLAHSTVALQVRLFAARDLYTMMFPTSLLVIAAWGTGLLLVIRRREQNACLSGLLSLVIIALPLEIAALSLSGFTFGHYYLAALPGATVLLAFLAWVSIEQRPLAATVLSLGLLLGAAYFASPYDSFARLTEKYTRDEILPQDAETRLAELIGRGTDPDDRILVWGKGARLHLLSGRNAPTRYFYHHPLVHPHYATRSMREGFLSDLEKEPPVLIIDSRHLFFPPLHRSERKDWRPQERYMHDLEDFRAYFAFVELNYLPVHDLPPFTVYSRRSDEYAPQAAALGRPVVHATYDVYLHGRALTYVKNSCAGDDARKRFILHVIPVDNSVIDGKSHATLDFNFLEGKSWQIGEGCLVSVELPAYPIASIRVGQYNLARTGDDWLSEYTFPQAE